MDIRIVERDLNGRKRWIICNGFKGRLGGYRAYVVDGLFSAKVVNHVDRRGAEWSRATHQVALNGDYVIYRANGDEWLTVFQMVHGALEKVDESDRRNVLRCIPLLIEEWLEVDESEHCKLPAGFGWDGDRTGSEISKFDRVEAFFKRSSVPNNIRRMLRPYILESRGIDMSTSWKQAHSLPENLPAGGIWVLWTQFNRPVILNCPVREHQLPSRLTRAMYIQIDHKNYSVSWSLYAAPRGYGR